MSRFVLEVKAEEKIKRKRRRKMSDSIQIEFKSSFQWISLEGPLSSKKVQSNTRREGKSLVCLFLNIFEAIQQTKLLFSIVTTVCARGD